MGNTVSNAVTSGHVTPLRTLFVIDRCNAAIDPDPTQGIHSPLEVGERSEPRTSDNYSPTPIVKYRNTREQTVGMGC